MSHHGPGNSALGVHERDALLDRLNGFRSWMIHLGQLRHLCFFVLFLTFNFPPKNNL